MAKIQKKRGGFTLWQQGYRTILKSCQSELVEDGLVLFHTGFDKRNLTVPGFCQ
jgi:hypothetical protein